jgi:transaldolase/glucose-6-phosphate isomerase
MASGAVQSLRSFGQSPWLDFIRRAFIEDGSLARLVAEDGLGGVTSNPAIFEKALASGPEYQAAFAALAHDGLRGVAEIYETIAIADIQAAADVLRQVYDATGGRDGFVSLEVSPYLAADADATVAEAKRLWAWVDRPNLMVKVPGTAACVPAIRALIEAGMNINVTLLFSQAAYQAVADAYAAGLEARAAAGLPVAGVASVASFFVSRIDGVIDGRIDKRVAAGDPEAAALAALRGKVAIANAKLAYRWFQEFSASPRWTALAAAGAAPQRLLWASTGTKDPAYSDVLYVEELIGADTVNTIPPATLDGFRDHGTARASLTENPREAAAILAEAERLGLDLPGVTDALVLDGVRLFAEAFDKLLGAVAARRAAELGPKLCTVTVQLPKPLAAPWAAALEDWRAGGKIRRLWARDASLFTGGPEDAWLGWLTAPEAGLAALPELLAFQADIKAAGFSDILLLGMGGSSLGPEVLARTFGPQPGWPTLHVLDSTDPQQIRAFEARLDLARTLVIVSSKSGGTLEPNILKAYFFARMVETVGAAAAGGHFVAVTDPGSHMQAVAQRDGFRRTFLGDPSIGGRFSVLSNFGLVPAAAAGLDVRALLEDAQRMARACGPAVPPAENPGVRLGAALAAAHAAGRDKLTVIANPGIAALGAWLEQLIAESTGKHGKAIIPIDGEPARLAMNYGKDRIFAYLRLASAPDIAQDELEAVLGVWGHPVLRLDVSTPAQVAQQFFLWEIATAVAGSLMGIDPFDQPDVEASKIKTRALTDAYNATGALPPEAPFARFGALACFSDAAQAKALAGATLADVLRAHFQSIGAGDYAAILAYVAQDPSNTEVLQRLRRDVAAGTGAATTLQFGPRFLHSTGQAYKGGPNSGVFLQITADDDADLPVPGERLTFGTAKAAQARGDFGVLTERGRRALRVHIAGDLAAGLAALADAVGEVTRPVEGVMA